MSKTHVYIILQMWHLCFTFWPSEPKVNRGIVFTKTKQNITYENSVINSFQ